MSRSLGLLLGLVIGVALAVAILFVGPSAHVVCESGHLGNRVAQNISQGLGGGHIDGAYATYCVVPSTATWMMAAAVLVGSVIVGGVASTRAVVTD